MPAALFALAVLLPYLGVPGSFRGVVVRGPDHQRGWIYVAGRNESLRRVEVTKAVVTYDEGVPAQQRRRAARQEIVEGAEIRVTGEPDAKGEWHASEIEIVKVSPKKRRALRAASGQRFEKAPTNKSTLAPDRWPRESLSNRQLAVP